MPRGSVLFTSAQHAWEQLALPIVPSLLHCDPIIAKNFAGLTFSSGMQLDEDEVVDVEDVEEVSVDVDVDVAVDVVVGVVVECDVDVEEDDVVVEVSAQQGRKFASHPPL